MCVSVCGVTSEQAAAAVGALQRATHSLVLGVAELGAEELDLDASHGVGHERGEDRLPRVDVQI